MSITQQKIEKIVVLPERCIVCGEKGSFRYFDREKYLFTCGKCGIVFGMCLPQREYEATVVEHYTAIDPAERVGQSRQGLYLSFLNKIEQRKRKSSRLLDIGCGRGYFCALASDRGWQCQGIDIAERLVQEGRALFALDLRCVNIKDIKGGNERFDVVTFWNVLEEVDDPVLVLEKCRSLLPPRGLLFIRTPNAVYHRCMARIVKVMNTFGLTMVTGRNAYIFHRFSFSAATIRRLLQKQGFTRIIVRNSCPTKGDPYQVGKGVGIIKMLVYGVAQVIYFLTFGKVCLSSSLEVYAEYE